MTIDRRAVGLGLIAGAALATAPAARWRYRMGRPSSSLTPTAAR